MIVDHTGRLLAAAKGYAGSMNDRSIIQHDAAIKEMQTSEVYTEKVYPLLVEHGVPVERKGNYSVVDNGNNKVNSYLLCPVFTHM